MRFVKSTTGSQRSSTSRHGDRRSGRKGPVENVYERSLREVREAAGAAEMATMKT
jgi:hypothetical protein